MKQYDGRVTVIRGESVYNHIRAHLQEDAVGWKGVLERFSQGSPLLRCGDEVILRFEDGGEGRATVVDAENRTQGFTRQGSTFDVGTINAPEQVWIEGQGPAPLD